MFLKEKPFFFGLAACGSLVSQLGMEPGPWTVRAQNHQGIPNESFLKTLKKKREREREMEDTESTRLRKGTSRPLLKEPGLTGSSSQPSHHHSSRKTQARAIMDSEE